MINLILVRHGQSQWNLENRFTGWYDAELTEKGLIEAQKAGFSSAFTVVFTNIFKISHCFLVLLNSFLLSASSPPPIPQQTNVIK